MTRFRITIKGTVGELRGYVDKTLEEIQEFAKKWGDQQVIVSPAAPDWNPFRITEPDNPPTPELSLEHMRNVWEESMALDESYEDFLNRIAMIHYAQATVIRGERAQREDAEAALVLENMEAQHRELHHFETEKENARLREILERILQNRMNHKMPLICDIHPEENDPIKCGWKAAVEDVDKGISLYVAEFKDAPDNM